MTTTILPTQYHYDVFNSRRSLEFLTDAINQKELPTRGQHAKMSVSHILFYEPCRLVKRLLEPAEHALDAVGILFNRENKQKKRCLFFKASCIILLSPFHIICHIASAVTRVASLVLGIAVPFAAAHLWKFAEKIELFNYEFKANVWKKIAPRNPYNIYESLECAPEAAMVYLNEKQLRSLAVKKMDAKAVEQAKQEISTAFPDWLALLFRESPATMEQLLKAQPPEKIPASFAQINNVLQKIAPQNNQTVKDSPAIVTQLLAAKTLSWQELDTLFTYLDQKIQQTNDADIRKQLQENLAFVLRFGTLKFPPIPGQTKRKI